MNMNQTLAALTAALASASASYEIICRCFIVRVVHFHFDSIIAALHAYEYFAQTLCASPRSRFRCSSLNTSPINVAYSYTHFCIYNVKY